MPTLLACLSTGKGTWSEVLKIIHSQPWEKVFLLTNAFGKEHFTALPTVELIVVDSSVEMSILVGTIKKELKDKVKDFEVGLNLASGSGKEHMALLEAVMESGLNFRLITVEGGKVKTLGLERG